jgi:uncharacterized protein YceK
MRTYFSRFINILLIVLVAGMVLSSCGSSNSQTTNSQGGVIADGQTLMQTRCTECHSLSRVISAHMTSSQWKRTVDKMILNGAQLTPSEEQVLVDYLAKNYP